MYYIYRITNKVNSKTYIGQHKYKKLDEYYMGSGVHLKRAQKKYGMENFKKDILVFNISKKEHADLLEKTFIASEREKVGVENCYNITDGGEGYTGKRSEETRNKISESHKGKQGPNKGKKHSEEWIRKMSESMKRKYKGKHFSDEHKKKLSEAHKGRHWKLVDGKRVWL